MMGIHGNGLTSLLWMKPTPQSTVMEFFFPEGYAHDYEYTTRGLGMMHFAFWNSRYVHQSIFPLSYTFCLPTSPVISPAQDFHPETIPMASKVTIFRSMVWLLHGYVWSALCLRSNQTIEIFCHTLRVTLHVSYYITIAYYYHSLLSCSPWQVMANIPPEIWFHVAKFIPKEDLRDLFGVNSIFFNIAMDIRYREIMISTTTIMKIGTLIKRLRCESLNFATEIRSAWLATVLLV